MTQYGGKDARMVDTSIAEEIDESCIVTGTVLIFLLLILRGNHTRRRVKGMDSVTLFQFL